MSTKETAGILAALLLVMIARPSYASPRKVVGLDFTFRTRTATGEKEYRVDGIELDSFRMLVELERTLEVWGYDVRRLNPLSASNLLSVDALVLGKLRDPSWRYLDDEIGAIVQWFNRGEKFLWVGGDGDKVESYYVAAQGGFRQREANRLLSALGSCLRLEFCSVEDVVGGGALERPDVVCAMASLGGVNGEGQAGRITSGTSKVLFYGSAAVVGFKADKWVPIEEVLSENVFWLYRTSEQGSISDHDTSPPVVLSTKGKGRIGLAAAEAMSMTNAVSRIVVTGQSILGKLNSYSSTYLRTELSGPTFVTNTVAWGLQMPSIQSRTTFLSTAIPSTTDALGVELGFSALPLGILIVTLIILVSSIHVKKRRERTRLKQPKAAKDESCQTTSAEYGGPSNEHYRRYLERLEELRAMGRISEKIYSRLKEEFEGKRRENSTHDP